QEQLEPAERGIAIQEDVWARMFHDLRVQPLAIWHEDVLANPAGAASAVAEFVGVALDPEGAVAVPEIIKQSVGDARAWAERYARSRG
ncbi:MAG TPA: Stf0 family sulfotransferase, partial [Gemmatimonadaceae bacterium]|nr:Stf0 family sulfotransferase [Gemmatimonadaceae bacterium]